MQKKALVIRLGAYGDMLIITPLLRKLKKDNYEVIVLTSERGEEILRKNPNVDKFILQKSSMPNAKCDKCDRLYYTKDFKKNNFCSKECSTDKNKELDSLIVETEDYKPRLKKNIVYNKAINTLSLGEHLEKIKDNVDPDLYINLCGSIERDLALTPNMPQYKYPKQERIHLSKINYYEHTLNLAKIEYDKKDLLPEIFFKKKDTDFIKSKLSKTKNNILIGLSGSGTNKVYPNIYYIVDYLIKEKNCHVITVGDYKCTILEDEFIDKYNPEELTRLCDKISMRESIALTKYVDLVICNDTGLLHGAGCFDTPKIGLLGHTTIENITKHFINDYSVESDPKLCPCAPCSRIIYSAPVYCPIDEITGVPYCMSYGISPKRIIENINEVLQK